MPAEPGRNTARGRRSRPALAGCAVVLALLCSVRPAAADGRRTVEESGVRYVIVDGRSVPNPLTGRPGDPARGRRWFVDRSLGNCLACHAVSALSAEEPDHGDIGPALDGVASRSGPGELRLRVVDARALDPRSVMPAYFRSKGLTGVARKHRGRTILTAEQVEDVVAFLGTLRD